MFMQILVHTPRWVFALFAWARCGAIAAAGVLAHLLPAGTACDAGTRSFVLAGSAAPARRSSACAPLAGPDG